MTIDNRARTSPATIRECTSAPPPATMLGRIRMWGDLDGGPGCANTCPWWASFYTACTLALAANWPLSALHLNSMATALLALLTGAIYNVTTALLNPRRAHATCGTCGLCSVHDGVPPAGNRKTLTLNLRAAGWRVWPGERTVRCPEHAGMPITITRLPRPRLGDPR